MGLMDNFKMRNALIQHRKGNVAAARAVYEELYAKGGYYTELISSD